MEKEKQLVRTSDEAIRHSLLRRLTNWQLSQWNKAGSPNDLQSIRHFVLLER